MKSLTNFIYEAAEKIPAGFTKEEFEILKSVFISVDENERYGLKIGKRGGLQFGYDYRINKSGETFKCTAGQGNVNFKANTFTKFMEELYDYFIVSYPSTGEKFLKRDELEKLLNKLKNESFEQFNDLIAEFNKNYNELNNKEQGLSIFIERLYNSLNENDQKIFIKAIKKLNA